jgi:hypothetical protein
MKKGLLTPDREMADMINFKRSQKMALTSLPSQEELDCPGIIRFD